MSPIKKCWSKSVGERGHKVRVYEQRSDGPLYLSVFNRNTGKEDRKSLRHRDKDRAIQQAYEKVSELLAEGEAIDRREITLGMLKIMYLKSPSHGTKKPQVRRQDEGKLRRTLGFLGPDRLVASLSESDVLRYVEARRRGESSLEGAHPGRRVGDRTVEADLVALNTALNWGTKHRTESGERLLPENPLFGLPFPHEKNPRRPVMSHSIYLSLLEVAPHVDSLLEVALVVAEGTARRLSAICCLTWNDIDLENAMICWRAENDKAGQERIVPMAPHVQEALREHHSRRTSIGDTPVFPSPKNPLKSCSRHYLDSLLRKAYELAGLTPEEGGLWHPIRRKWVTERKGHPADDLALAGGWKDKETMGRCYSSADPKTTKEVVETTTHRYEAAEG